MLTHEQNELLTRVEGDAPMGRLMREHYWIPSLLSAEARGRRRAAARAPPRRGPRRLPRQRRSRRVLRRSVSAPRLLARARGNEDCGLRCIFHGWKIDVGGFVSDVPTHAPNPEAFAAKVPVEHHPVHEGGGIVWVWLGETPAPPFPELPFTALDDRQVWMTITQAYCNWLQGVEATLDSAHVGTLHEAYITGGPTPATSRSPTRSRRWHRATTSSTPTTASTRSRCVPCPTAAPTCAPPRGSRRS